MAEQNTKGAEQAREHVERLKKVILGRIGLMEAALTTKWPGKQVDCEFEDEQQLVVHGREATKQWWLEISVGQGSVSPSMPSGRLWLFYQVEAGSNTQSRHFAANESGLHDAREWLTKWLATD